MIQLILFLSFFSFSANAAIISFEQDSSLPVVYLNVVFKTGAIHDPKGLEGLSQLTTEMLLRGTLQQSKESMDTALDFMGADLSVETRSEAAILRGVFLSAQLDSFLKLFQEILIQPAFKDAELTKLKSELSSKILEEQSHDSILAGKFFNSFLFEGHPYGNPPHGTLKSISKITIQDIKNHYKKYFRAQRMLILGAGDATEAKLSTWLKSFEGNLSGGEPVSSLSSPPLPQKNRLLFVDKPDRTQTQVFLGQVGVRMDDPSFFPLHLGNFSFGGGNFSARMMHEIRVKRGWSYGANSIFRFGTRPRSWHMYYFPASKDTVAALALGLEMLSELRGKGITSDEFEFSKKSIINSAAFMYDTPQKRVENLILEKILNLPDGYMKSYAKHLELVTLEQVNAALRSFLAPDKVSILVLGTAKDLKEQVVQASGVLPADVQVKSFSEE